MKSSMWVRVAAAVTLVLGTAGAARAADPAADAISRGRYLITIGGCNDCHSDSYLQNGGKLPESEWLKGTTVGYQGPWGTTYPTNLRLSLAGMTEAQWLVHARQERLPPMPWFNLAKMTDADLKAVYAYVRSLGAVGAVSPAYVAPGGKVATPYYAFVPVTDTPQARR
jgi:mono/diheme cytochrome c family protein